MKDEMYVDYDTVLESVMYVAMNKEKYHEMAESMPHRDFLDLVFFYAYRRNPEYKKYSLMTYEKLEEYGMSEKDLDEHAAWNSEQTYQYQTFANCIPDFKDILCDSIDMLVLTNKTMSYGAAAISSTRQMNMISNLYNSNLILFPSSIHEIIIIPESPESDKKDLRDIVESVNQTVLEPEDFLSDHVYRYNREEQKVEIFS